MAPNRVSDSAAECLERAAQALETAKAAEWAFYQFCIAGDWRNAAQAAVNATAWLQAYYDARMAAYQRMAE